MAASGGFQHGKIDDNLFWRTCYFADMKDRFLRLVNFQLCFSFILPFFPLMYLASLARLSLSLNKYRQKPNYKNGAQIR